VGPNIVVVTQNVAESLLIHWGRRWFMIYGFATMLFYSVSHRVHQKLKKSPDKLMS